MRITAQAASSDEMASLLRGIRSFASISSIVDKPASTGVVVNMDILLEVADPITIDVACDILGVTDGRVKGLIATGALVAVKPHGKWMVSRASVEARAANPPKPGRPW